jgi:hypothetical protein
MTRPRFLKPSTIMSLLAYETLVSFAPWNTSSGVMTLSKANIGARSLKSAASVVGRTVLVRSFLLRYHFGAPGRRTSLVGSTSV